MKFKVIFLVFTFSFTVFSCTKKEEPDFSDQSYFPVETGLFYIYSVEEINYDLTGKEVKSYQLLEVIADTLHFFDEVKYRVERFTRSDSNAAWPEQPDSVWTVSRDNFKVVKTENNYNYIKLVFPTNDQAKWDGNGLNVLDQDDYEIKNTGKPYVLDGKSFLETVTVLQHDEESLIDKDYRVEVYGRNLGLIYKEKQVYEYDEDFIGQDTTVIEFGQKYIQRLISSGKN